MPCSSSHPHYTLPPCRLQGPYLLLCTKRRFLGAICGACLCCAGVPRLSGSALQANSVSVSEGKAVDGAAI